MQKSVTPEELGEVAFAAYAEAVEWYTINGRRLAPFRHQDAKQQDAWDAVGVAVKTYLEKE
jgi:hypothetical protein